MTQDIVVCVANDTRVDRHHGCTRVMGAIEHLLGKNGFTIAAMSPAHSDWTRDSKFLHALESSALVVVNGEGTIHHDRPEGLKLLELGGHAKSRGIPAVLVNAGWEANGPRATAMLRDFACVAVRDSQSARELREANVACTVVPDLSLYLPTGDLPSHDPADPIAFTDSVDRFKSAALDAARRSVGGTTISITYPGDGLLGYLRFLRGGFAARDILAPGVLARVLMSRHRLWRSASPDSRDFLLALAGARHVVSGRFHACALALLTQTPFTAIASNTAKIATLVCDAGLESWRAQAELSPSAIVDAAARGWSVLERRALSDYAANARSAADDLFRGLRTLT